MTKEQTTEKKTRKPKAVATPTASGVLEAPLYSQEAKVVGTVELPSSVFGVAWNADLVHQVVHALQSNKRAGTADAKTRGEVRGGGKKPWKQKGTGRARHGSTRSPIWIGGGVTHGPLSEKNYTKKVSKKMKIKALYTILSKKFKDGEVLFVDAITLPKAKTQVAEAVLRAIAKAPGFGRLAKSTNRIASLVMPASDTSIERSFRNLPHVTVGYAQEMNPLMAISSKYMVVVGPKESMAILSGKMDKARTRKVKA